MKRKKRQEKKTNVTEREGKKLSKITLSFECKYNVSKPTDWRNTKAWMWYFTTIVQQISYINWLSWKSKFQLVSMLIVQLWLNKIKNILLFQTQIENGLFPLKMRWPRRSHQVTIQLNEKCLINSVELIVILLRTKKRFFPAMRFQSIIVLRKSQKRFSSDIKWFAVDFSYVYYTVATHGIARCAKRSSNVKCVATHIIDNQRKSYASVRCVCMVTLFLFFFSRSIVCNFIWIIYFLG